MRAASKVRRGPFRSFLCLGIALALIGFAPASPLGAESPGCDLKFGGSDRKAVKNRETADGVNYEVRGDPTPLSIKDWFDLTCSLNANLPEIVGSKAPAVQGCETMKVTVRGYLLAVRQEGDNDFHVQIGPKNRWTKGQVVVEVPPGQADCDARKVITDLVSQDIDDFGGNSIKKGHILRHRALIDVTGFLFFDGAHGSSKKGCTKNGNRGIRGSFSTSPVRGLWEIHPVTEVSVVEN